MKHEDWKAAMDEVDLPEPKPGKKIISFTLPEQPLPAPKKAAKKKPEPRIGLSDEQLAIMNKEDYSLLADSPRRRAREGALLLLFAAGWGSKWELAGNILDDVGLSGENRAFALDLAERAYNQRQDSDELLNKYAREWDVSRFSAVDRAVLRLAVAELRREESQSATIIINEAIELAKKFGSEDSGSFVNAILDNIRLHELNQPPAEGQP